MPDQQKYITKLQGSRVLIIGGTSGIGYAIAEACLEHNCTIILSSSSPSKLQTAITTLSASYPSATNRITGHPCDLSTESTLETSLTHLFTQTGQVDHIAFTAGNPVPPIPLAKVSVEQIHSAATVRYTAAIFVAKLAETYLSPTGSLTLTTGVVTEKPIPGWSAIAGGRSAVLGLGKALALDLRPRRVNVVAVGAVDTPTWDGLSAEVRERTMEGLVKKTTTGRMAAAEDVAEAYLYLMKDRNVTGSVVSSNGGVLLT